MNISNVHSVQITASNVEDLYNNIDTPNSQNSTFQCGQAELPHHNPPGNGIQVSGGMNADPLSVDNLLSLLRSMQKELFITHVLRESSTKGSG